MARTNSHDHAENYGKRALESECARVLGSAEGERNTNLNRASFALGQLVAAEKLDRGDVERHLLAAALGVGLTRTEALGTMKPAIARGMVNPRGEDNHQNGHVNGRSTDARRTLDGRAVRVPPEGTPDPPEPEDNGKPAWATMEEAIARLRGIKVRDNPAMSESHTAYPYHDANGEPIGAFVRWESPTGKVPGWVAKYAKGWQIRQLPSPRIPYRLPDLNELPDGCIVYLTEGEKCADCARSIGLHATTFPGGGNGVSQGDFTHLARFNLALMPDLDATGEAFAKKATEMAHGAGCRSVRVIDYADTFGLAKGTKADIVEALEAVQGDAKECRRRLGELYDGAADDTYGIPFEYADRLIVSAPAMRPVILEGLLRVGEVMNVVAAPKTGKSWLVHGLSISAIAGRRWLGRTASSNRVLLIDGELHHETLAHRLRITQAQLGVFDTDMRRLNPLRLRDNPQDIHHLTTMLDKAPPRTWGLIIIDPLYQIYPPGFEENSNEQMTRLYRQLNAIATHAQAGVIAVHHTSKGSQADKSNTDVGAGAGAQSRAADTHLTLREHEEKDAVIVSVSARSFPPIDPFCIRSTRPGWELAPDLDPEDHKRAGRKREPEAPPPPDWTPERFASEIIGKVPRSRDAIWNASRVKKIPERTARSLLAECLDTGLAVENEVIGTKHKRISVP